MGESGILATDASYDEGADCATFAGIVFLSWQTEQVADTITRRISGLAPYQPGEFFRRELPGLISLVSLVRERHPISTVIVDGFVDLGERGPGLGRHLFNAFDGAFEVIGVAKNPFAGHPGQAVHRGTSMRPLWVTSTGSLSDACANVQSMAGGFRVPTLLKVVDALARGRTEDNS